MVSSAEPVQCDQTTLFIQRYNLNLMEYFADVFSGKFSAPDLALPAKHLTGRTLQELAYQQSISPVVWARCGDGSLLGCSYKRDSLMSSKGPTFAGWHEHVLGDGRTVTSIAVGPSADGSLDTLAAVTTSADHSNHVSFLRPLFKETDTITAAWHLDHSVAPSSMTTNGTTSMTFNGLWHLNGKTVSVWAGGVDCGDLAVSNGSVTVPFGGLFTAAYAAGFGSALPVMIGFTYTSDRQLLQPATPADNGARNGPAFAKRRRQHQTALLLLNMQGDFGRNHVHRDQAGQDADRRRHAADGAATPHRLLARHDR